MVLSSFISVSKGGLGWLKPQPFSGLLVTMKGATPGTNGCFASHRIPSEFLLQDITGLLSTFRDSIWLTAWQLFTSNFKLLFLLIKDVFLHQYYWKCFEVLSSCWTVPHLQIQLPSLPASDQMQSLSSMTLSFPIPQALGPSVWCWYL